jgi:transcriptional regulator with XRE-family HTH domain
MPAMAKPSPNHAGHPVLVALGQSIRGYRLAKNLSQERLAFEAGIDRSYMGGIERGEHNLTVISLAKIAEQLEVRCSELLDPTDI